MQLMRREIGIMQRISYDPHIAQFFGACTTTEPAMLVMEFMRVSARRHLQICILTLWLTRPHAFVGDAASGRLSACWIFLIRCINPHGPCCLRREGTCTQRYELMS